MTYPTSGGTPDPYQPQQPYGQPYEQPPAAPYQPELGQPEFGQAYKQPAYGQNPYGAPPPYGQPMYPPATAATNTLAILSLVFAFVFPIAGIVMGHIARKQIRQSGEQGEGLATAGLVISYIFTGIGALICAFYIVVVVIAVGSSATNAAFF